MFQGLISAVKDSHLSGYVFVVEEVWLVLEPPAWRDEIVVKVLALGVQRGPHRVDLLRVVVLLDHELGGLAPAPELGALVIVYNFHPVLIFKPPVWRQFTWLTIIL